MTLCPSVIVASFPPEVWTDIPVRFVPFLTSILNSVNRTSLAMTVVFTHSPASKVSYKAAHQGMIGEIHQPSLNASCLQRDDSVRPEPAWNNDVVSSDTHCPIDTHAEDTAMKNFYDQYHISLTEKYSNLASLRYLFIYNGGYDKFLPNFFLLVGHDTIRFVVWQKVIWEYSKSNLLFWIKSIAGSISRKARNVWWLATEDQQRHTDYIIREQER